MSKDILLRQECRVIIPSDSDHFFVRIIVRFHHRIAFVHLDLAGEFIDFVVVTYPFEFALVFFESIHESASTPSLCCWKRTECRTKSFPKKRMQISIDVSPTHIESFQCCQHGEF